MTSPKRPVAPIVPAGGGVLLVDKPAGCTSHDVVGRVRWLLRTRRVGHAGTLDPMATGLLVLAVDRATRLLGHLALTGKTYVATIRLGMSTSTDDAEGEPTGGSDASGLSDPEIRRAIAGLTGDLMQVPSSVSAIKVGGRRAYELVRAGERIELAARPVHVERFDLVAPIRRRNAVADLDVRVECTTGTYVRALARDLGATLRVGGHLTALRRTRSGPFDVVDAVQAFNPGPLPDRGTPSPAVDQEFVDRIAARILPVADVVRAAFDIRVATDAEAADLRYGRPVKPVGISGTYGVLDPSGTRVAALVRESDGAARPVLVWDAAG